MQKNLGFSIKYQRERLDNPEVRVFRDGNIGQVLSGAKCAETREAARGYAAATN